MWPPTRGPPPPQQGYYQPAPGFYQTQPPPHIMGPMMGPGPGPGPFRGVYAPGAPGQPPIPPGPMMPLAFNGGAPPPHQQPIFQHRGHIPHQVPGNMHQQHGHGHGFHPPPHAVAIAPPAAPKTKQPQNNTSAPAAVAVVTGEGSKPALTLWVGKIPLGTPADAVLALLELCGGLLSWKRASDPITGRLQPFGFATFRSPADVIRVVELGKHLEERGYVPGENSFLIKIGEALQQVVALATGENDSADNKERNRHLAGTFEAVLRAIYDKRDWSAVLRAKSSSLDSSTTGSNSSRSGSVDGNHSQRGGGLSRGGGDVSDEISHFRQAEGRARSRSRSPYGRSKRSRSRSNSPGRNSRSRSRSRSASPPSSRQRDSNRTRGRGRSRERTPPKSRVAERALRHFEEKIEDLRSELSRREKRGHDFDAKLKAWNRYERSLNTTRAQFNQEVAIHAHDENAYSAAAAVEQSLRGSGEKPLPTWLELCLERIERDTAFEGPESDWYRHRKEKRHREQSADRRARRYAEEKARRAEEVRMRREKLAVAIMERDIPKETPELFAYEIDWQLASTLGERIRGFVQAKVTEMVGTPDQPLISHIMTLLGSRTTAAALADSVKAILDDEAEKFVVRLWRFIIFETLFDKKSREEDLDEDLEKTR